MPKATTTTSQLNSFISSPCSCPYIWDVPKFTCLLLWYGPSAGCNLSLLSSKSREMWDCGWDPPGWGEPAGSPCIPCTILCPPHCRLVQLLFLQFLDNCQEPLANFQHPLCNKRQMRFQIPSQYLFPPKNSPVLKVRQDEPLSLVQYSGFISLHISHHVYVGMVLFSNIVGMFRS